MSLSTLEPPFDRLKGGKYPLMSNNRMTLPSAERSVGSLCRLDLGGSQFEWRAPARMALASASAPDSALLRYAA